MQPAAWQERSTALLPVALNTKIVARIGFFEDELRKRGLHVVAGAEQEFFTFNQKGNVVKALSLKKLRQAVGNMPMLENVIHEQILGKHEVVFGAGRALHAPHPALSLARQILSTRQTMPLRLQRETRATRTSFSPTENFADGATAGLHINLSLFDDHGENQFFDKCSRSFSTLMKFSARRLLQLQKEGFALYAPDAQSCARFGRYELSPAEFRIAPEKDATSLALRPGVDEGQHGKAEFYRMEDRLAGADVNPYIVLLAGIGAMHAEVTHGNALHMPSSHGSIMRSTVEETLSLAQEEFRKSASWRAVAGEDLYRDLAAHVQIQAQKPAGASR